MGKKLGRLVWFVLTSLKLDYATLRYFPAPVGARVIFLIQKYLSLLKHLFRPFQLGQDFIKLRGRRFYYDSRFGLAGYQGIFTRQRQLLALMKQKVKVMVDIGANVGTFSLLVRTLYPEAKIIAVEPVRPVYDALERNVTPAGIKPLNAAITDREGEVKLAYDANNSAVSHIDRHGRLTARGLTLDTLVKENNLTEISLLKIDTEGFEDAVLAGARAILPRTDYIHMEITIDNNPRYTISSLLRLLVSDEYNFQLVGFRNFFDKGEGHIPLMDVLLVNIHRI